MDPDSLREVVRAAVEASVEAILGARAAEPAPSPTLPPWMSTAAYARHVGVSPRTVARWARRAPEVLVAKYGGGWRVAGPAFDRWVRNGGPNRVHEEEPKEQVH